VLIKATAKASRTIRSRHRLITTGTIIQNGRVNELWATFDFLMPNFLGDSTCFSRDFARPITRGQLPGASARAISESIDKLKTLHQQCLPFILRRDKDKVLQELPPKIVTVIPVPMSALQEKMYESFLNRPFAEGVLNKLQQMLEGTDNSHDDTSSGGDALRSLLLLRLVCTHPALVSRTNEVPSVSGLGLEASGKLVALVELLRESGIYKDTTSGADNDRSLLFCGTDEVSNDFDSLVESTVGSCSQVNPQNARKADQSKCVIFSQFNKSLDIVEHLVLKRLMPSTQYLRLDGSVPAERRAAIATSFNCDPSIKILLSTTRVGGLGLNLTGTLVLHVCGSFNPGCADA
jgi:TATA-binding protein-associated factor